MAPAVTTESGDRPVLRLFHGGVVAAWRTRDRLLRARGVSLVSVTARRWNEGGRVVDCEPGEPVTTVRTFGRHPNGFLYEPFQLGRLLRTVRPSLLDLHEEPCSLAVAEVLLLGRLLRIDAPVVLYSAQNIPKRYPWPISWLERRALALAAGAYVCNRDAGLILRAKGFTGTLVEIPLGVDLACFRPTERDAPTDPPTVGYVGRLARHKGVEVLLRAVAAEPEWRLVLFGEGPDRQRLEALAEELGLKGRVAFAGARRVEELADEYRSLDVLAVPSVPWPGWLEQFGRVAVEAMASGVPVVASRSGALPDVVEGAGVLVAPGDPVALCEGLRRVLESPERWRACRAAGLLRAEQFSWESVAEAHSALYEAVRRGTAAAISSTDREQRTR